MNRRSVLLALAALPACAELRRPNIAMPAPAGLWAPNEDAGRAAVALLERDARGASLGLKDDPARVARLAAVLEYLASEVPVVARWAPVSRGAKDGLGPARDELRASLGVDALTPAARLIPAFSATARALPPAGPRDAAARTLPDTLFPRGGGTAALDRLANPGPLPAVELAANALAEDVRRLDATNGWSGGLDIPVPADRGGLGGTGFNVDSLRR